jgi:hypothetical protein
MFREERSNCGKRKLHLPPVDPSPVKTWKTPGGNPASLIRIPKAVAEKGVFSLDLGIK